jgi:hypothetical protein
MTWPKRPAQRSYVLIPATTNATGATGTWTLGEPIARRIVDATRNKQ